MKALISAVAAAAILSIPALSFAQQSDAQPTRAQVRAELAQLEKAGYNPNANDTAYPANIHANIGDLRLEVGGIGTPIFNQQMRGLRRIRRFIAQPKSAHDTREPIAGREFDIRIRG